MMFLRRSLQEMVDGLRDRARDVQRQVDDLAPRDGKPARAGYRRKLERLQDVRHALLHAENRLNRG